MCGRACKLAHTEASAHNAVCVWVMPIFHTLYLAMFFTTLPLQLYRDVQLTGMG